MFQFIIRRILLAIPVIFGIMLVTFALSRMIPGDPCRAMLGEKATADVCARFTVQYGLDKPIPVQFGIYIAKVLQGDFGNSIRFSRPVMLILVERLPMTAELGLFALILSVIVGIPAGILSAIKRNSAADVTTMVVANVGVSMPVYWLGLMLIYTFALLLKDTFLQLPPSGRITAGLASIPFYELWGWTAVAGSAKDYFLQFVSNLYIFNGILTGNWEVVRDAFKHLILPAIALGTIPLAIIARMTRSSMLEVLKQDYIRTARAKGLRKNLVILKHALRNALLPIVTIIGLEFGILFAGALLTETIFGLAGVGRMLFEAITARDFPIIQAFTVVIAIGYVFVNLIVDISYVFIDPRIRLE